MNPIKVLLAVFFLFACRSVPPSSETVPVDKAYVQGRLANGLQYYIRPNQTPNNRIFLALAVKVGSLQEEDDEQGLAHYLEHMAFNGSEHFPGNSLMEFARDIGMGFGAHINAYTSFDRTVYTLNLPADDPEVVSKGLTVLVDWARGLTISAEEVERERGVVLSEYRLNQSADDRLYRKYYRNWFGDSRYARRIPIGNEEVLQQASAEQLQSFYQKWYHPSFMAVTVTGAVDPQAFEQEIAQAFDWDAAGPPPRKEDHLPTQQMDEGPLFFVNTDPEIGSTTSFLLIKADYRSADYSQDYLLYSLTEQLITGILTQRIHDSKSEGNPPFVYAYPLTPNSFHFGKESFLGITMDHKVDQFEAGFRWLFQEYQRWQSRPFTTEELAFAKSKLTTQLATYFESLETLPSAAWQQSALADFFAEGIIEDPAWLQQQLPSLLEQVSLTSLQQLFDRWRQQGTKLVQVSGNDSSDIPSLEELRHIYQEEIAAPATDVVKVKAIETLLPSAPIAGQITDEEETDGFTGWHWRLNNGAQVYFIPTQVEKQSVALRGWRDYGMLSIEDRSLYYNANNFNELADYSGLSQFTAAQLSRYLSDKVASVTSTLGHTQSHLSGQARTQDLETMMQLVYLQFFPTQYRKQDLDKVIEDRLSRNAEQETEPQLWGYQEFQRTIYGDDFRADPFFSAEERRALSLERMSQLQKEFFDGAGSFTFVIAGDATKDQVKLLVEKYLASLPRGVEGKRTTADLPYRFSPGEVERRRGNNGNAWLQLLWAWNEPQRLTEKESLAWGLLAKLLTIRLQETIREEMGGSYSSFSIGRFRPHPAPRLVLTVSTDFNPEEKNLILNSVKSLIDDVKNGGISARHWQQVVEQKRRELENVEQELGYWLRSIKSQREWDRPVTNLKTLTLSLLDQLRSQDLVRLAKQYLDDEHLLVYAFIQQETPTLPNDSRVPQG